MSRDSRKTFSPLRAILGRFWESSGGSIALVVLISVAAALASVSAPYVFSRLIDGLTADKRAETIVAGFGLYAMLMGLALALQQIALYLAAVSAENVSFITGTSFFDRLVRKSAAFFIEHNPVEIQTAQVQGAQALYLVIRISLIVLLPGAAQLLLTLLVLGAALNWGVVTIVVIYGAAFIALTYFSNIWARPHLERAIAVGQENAKFVGNAITAMETLRYFGSTPWMSERFTRSARDVFESWKSFCMKHMVYAGVFGLVLAVQFAITFALLLPRHRQGQLSAGDLVLFNALLLQLNQPFQMAGQAIEELVPPLPGSCRSPACGRRRRTRTSQPDQNSRRPPVGWSSSMSALPMRTGAGSTMSASSRKQDQSPSSPARPARASPPSSGWRSNRSRR